MADLVFKKENVEKLLLEAGFSDIKSRPFSSFEEQNAFRTEAFLYKNSSQEIHVSIECLSNQIGISMQNNIDLEMLKNQHRIILLIENGKISGRDAFELNDYKSKSIFCGANRKLTNFISNLEKITLQ